MKDRRWGALLAALVFLGGCPPAKPAETPTATVKDAELPTDPVKLIDYADIQFRTHTVEGMQNAIKALDKTRTLEPGSYAVLWRLARAYVSLGDEYDDAPRMEDFAKKGMEAAKAAVAADGSKVEGHYYLGTATGQYAFVKKLKAKDMVPLVVESARTAVKIDEGYDEAGPLRLLGAVYAQAPEPPTSVGDHEEGIKVLGRAIQLAGSYPQNHLLMGDAQLTERNLDQAEREYDTVLSMHPSAGDSWARKYPKWRRQAQDGLKRVYHFRRQTATDRGSPF